MLPAETQARWSTALENHVRTPEDEGSLRRREAVHVQGRGRSSLWWHQADGQYPGMLLRVPCTSTTEALIPN